MDTPNQTETSIAPTGELAANSQLGAYRLIRQIGAGGMGAVWLAEHALLGRRAAIKVLHPAFSARTDIVTRFFNEARAATSIADPGIVQIFDFGHHTDGSAYIVMELLDGETLHARCRSGLSVTDALRIMRQVAASLGAAHARGIVHRDLKPENIFLVRDPEVPGGERAKILDFGIAKLNVADAGIQTQTAALMGTPMFMSPEQCRGAGEVDARADIYSLGCVLFAVLTGRAPFVAEGVGELIVKHMTEPAPLASTIAPGIPAVVDALIARCLDKSPLARFADGTALAAAIGALLEQPVSHSQPVAAELAAAPTTLSGSIASISPVTPRRSRRGYWIGGLVGIVGTAIVAFASVSSDDNAVSALAAPSLPPAPPSRPAVPVSQPVESEPVLDREERHAAAPMPALALAEPEAITVRPMRASKREPGKVQPTREPETVTKTPAEPKKPETATTPADEPKKPEIKKPDESKPEIKTPHPETCPLDSKGRPLDRSC